METSLHQQLQELVGRSVPIRHYRFVDTPHVTVMKIRQTGTLLIKTVNNTWYELIVESIQADVLVYRKADYVHRILANREMMDEDWA